MFLDKLIHQNEISILNSKLRSNFEFSDGSIKFKSSQSIIKNTPVNFQGNIDIKPFFVEVNLDSKSFDLNYFFNKSFWFNEIIKSKLIQNENLNGKIFITSEKILKNKIFDSVMSPAKVFDGRNILGKDSRSNSKHFRQRQLMVDHD